MSKSVRKCDTCKVQEDIQKSDAPACCAWYMDNVVLGNKTENDCPLYKKVGSSHEDTM